MKTIFTITYDILENDRTHWRSDPWNVPKAVRYKTWLPNSSGSFSFDVSVTKD